MLWFSLIIIYYKWTGTFWRGLKIRPRRLGSLGLCWNTRLSLSMSINPNLIKFPESQDIHCKLAVKSSFVIHLSPERSRETTAKFCRYEKNHLSLWTWSVVALQLVSTRVNTKEMTELYCLQYVKKKALNSTPILNRKFIQPQSLTTNLITAKNLKTFHINKL